MRNFSLSLRARVLLLIGVLFAVFLGVEWLHANSMRRMRLEVVKQNLRLDAELFAAQEKSIVDHARGVVEGLVNGRRGHSLLDLAECQHMVAQQVGHSREFANAIVMAPDGNVTCSATPIVRPYNLADRSYFQQALASPGVIVGEVIVGRISGKRLLPVIEAVRDEGGRPLELFAVLVDLSKITTQVAESEHPAGATFGLLDPKGRVLVGGPDAEAVHDHDFAGMPLIRALTARSVERTFDEIGVDGVRRLYGVAPFTETASGPIWFWYSLRRDLAIADIERDFIWSVAATICLLLVTFVAVWIGGTRLVLRPVSVLAAAAHRMGKGDLSVRSGLVRVRGELGTLAKSFDGMAASLEARNHDVLLASRAVKVLSTWNRTLVESPDERALMKSMCRAIVEAGGYRGAWVGFARTDENKTVEPVASWGMDPESVGTLGVTWADAPRGRGPAGMAIRRGTVVIMNDYMTNPDTAPWREYALRHQLKSLIALPLRPEGAVIGALTIQAAESESFGEQEAVLLGEVAAALSSGIAAVRARAARSELEASLQTSEERFRAAAEASLDALIVLRSVRDATGNLIDFETADLNSRAARRLGRTREELVGKTYFELAPLHGLARFFRKYVQVVESRAPLEEEFPFDLPGIQRKWFRQQVVAVGDGIAISLRDITAWKTAGDKIREGEERLTLAMSAAHMGAFSVNLTDDTYTLSEEAGPILGLPKGAGPRTTAALLEFVHPDDREALARGIARSREMVQPARREFRVVWPDGTIHWVESHGRIICDEAGKPVRSVGVLADITQRKQDVAALQSANRALKTLSAGNEVLVHARSESELLHDICRVIVDKGAYRMAWVGYPQDNYEKTIVPAGWAGVEDGYFARIRLTWADNELGQRPVSRALRSGEAQTAQDIRADAAFAPVRELVERPGYASNLALPLLDAGRVIGVMSIFASEADAFDEAEVRLLQELADDLAYGIVTLRTREERDRIAHAHANHEATLRKSLEDSIQAIAATVEMRDPYTSGHQTRVAELAVALAREMGLPEERIHGLHLAGVVHDLGKISIPAEILAKPGKLTPIEFALIQGHAEAGYEILKDIAFPWPIATIVRQHHERLDGSGYPQRLKGEDILLESRIMAVADVVEAMGSHRPYRPTLGIDIALQEIERGRGIKYDPAVTDACLKLFRDGRYVLAA